ncbi:MULTISPECIES: helix-turn-helix domain-containing protein [Proteus]|uniref:helix-turn-helix domain-containing protein n=1 Tax=Proteus TaxID=583 RepID=UPI0005006881|nr:MULTISPECIES: helix-turn-helix transcriptional regulator [Proteus]KGA59621.1 helix-turn-helix family protein [Proteus vulgaris]NBN47123.1 helix-turn-helix domain-containing protein [Proteus sp. G2626]
MTSFPKQQKIKNGLSYGSSPYRKKRLKKDINFIVGRQLKALRLKKTLNGTQLGKMLGISQQQVSRYENGVTTLSIDAIVTICLCFNLSLKEFLAPLMVLTENKNESIETLPLSSPINLDLVADSARSFICPPQDESMVMDKRKRR